VLLSVASATLCLQMTRQQKHGGLMMENTLRQVPICRS